MTPTLSVAAAQLSAICVLLAAVAARLVGAVGGVVSPPATGTVYDTSFEAPLCWPDVL